MNESTPPRVSSSEDHWVVDKKIPLAQIISLALFLLAQSAGLVWWLSGQSAQIADLQRRTVQLESARAGERLTALEALLPRVEAQLNRMESKIDRLKE